MKGSANFEQVIEPTEGWLVIDWRALVQYRDLLSLMVRRDFVAKYKQTVLGPLWFIIQPLLTTMVFTVIFGNLAHISTDGLPQMLFYQCGLLPWAYFSQTLPGISTCLISNSGLFSKVYFPRLVVPISLLISNSFAFVLQFVTFLGFYLYFKAGPAGETFHGSWGVLAIPLLLVHTALIALGYGLWLSALTAKYRDFTHLMTFLVQLWMYATPVIYPLSKVPHKWRLVMALNPMTSVVEAFRYVMFGVGTVSLTYVGISVGITIVVLISGLAMFGKVERTFVDVV